MNSKDQQLLAEAYTNVNEQSKPFNSFTASHLLKQLTETLPEEHKFEYLVRTLTDRKYFNEIQGLAPALEELLNAELASMQDVMSMKGKPADRSEPVRLGHRPSEYPTYEPN